MLAEIITIGDEILIGQIVDTNSVFIAKELNKIGIKVFQITSIQDDREHILQSLHDANERVDIVFVTGGLGPTKDDITKKTFLEYFDDTLVENTEVLENIKRIFLEHIGRDPLPSNLEQAQVPSKAVVLNNLYGTAPGMWIEKNNTAFISMPGVPFEMKRLMNDAVLPKIVAQYNRPFIYHKTLLTYGKGESQIEEIIREYETALPSDIKLAYLPSLGRVRLRLSSTGSDELLLKQAVDAQMKVLHNMLIDIAVGYEDESSIISKISEALLEKNLSLSVVESCTGGKIASEITEIAGASSYFKGGLVPYSTRLKSDVLGVDRMIIDTHSVVSVEVAKEMALKSNALFKTDYAVSTTGIAGPTKGDAMDAVGTVCIAVAGPEGVISEKFNFGNARERVIGKAVNKAFEMLLKEISKN